MAQDLFGTFDQDLQRLLLAGSGAVGEDEGLLRAQDAFGKLATKVPALAAVQAQLGKVLGARGRAAATELLNLGVMNLRIRGAQAKPAAGEGLSPLPPAAPLETSTPQHDLEAIHRALTSGISFSGKKIQRARVVEDSIGRGTFRDLRLLDLWVKALTDPALGDLVAERVIPALGEAAAARIERQFNPRGKSADARRLRCLVAIRGEAARPLVEACLQATEAPQPLLPEVAPARGKKAARKKTERDASVEVRTAAVEALEKVAPAEAEERACALYRSETQQEVRAACVQVMGVGDRVTTLELLLTALRDSSHVSTVAVESLQRFRHPKTTERVLALLTPEALDIKPYKPPRAKAGQKLTRAQQQTQQQAQQKALQAIEQRADLVGSVIQVLGKRPSPEVIDRLIELFRRHPVASIREAAGEALKASGERRALEVLVERLDSEEDDTEALSVWAFFHLDPGSAFERMQPYLTDQALSTKKGVAVASKLLGEISGEGYFLDEMDTASEEDSDAVQDQDAAIPGLDGAAEEDEGNDDDPHRDRRQLRYPFRTDPRWVDVALKRLDHKGLTEHCIEILGNLRDPRGRDPLLDLLRKKVYAHSAAHALFRIGDRSVIPQLIPLLSSKEPSSGVIHLLGSFKASEAIDPLCALLSREPDLANLIFEALRCIGDPRAAPAIAAALLHKGVNSYPYQAIRALRRLDNPAAIPSIQEAMKKAKKSRNTWVVTQYEELIAYLERDRKV
jgi:HEAT repeat protein